MYIKDKYERSVQCSEGELNLMETQVESDVEHVCNNTEISESSNCVHCHINSIVITSQLQSAY